MRKKFGEKIQPNPENMEQHLPDVVETTSQTKPYCFFAFPVVFISLCEGGEDGKVEPENLCFFRA